MVDKFGCLNNTIKTYAGHYFDLVNPTPESVDIVSIANALSKVCRFGGHTPKFYSVAEHLLHCVDVASQHGIEGKALQAVILHDAAEAYIGDVVKPLKVLLPEFAVIEARIEAVIGQRFRVSFEEHHETIKRFDRMMLKTEKQQMWPEDAEKWNGFGGVESADVELEFYTPEDASRIYLDVAEYVGVM